MSDTEVLLLYRRSPHTAKRLRRHLQIAGNVDQWSTEDNLWLELAKTQLTLLSRFEAQQVSMYLRDNQTLL